jgi:serine/threonine-protein kinase
MKLCPACGTEWPDGFNICPNDGTGLPTSSGAHDLVGSILTDRYLIESRIGEGGMGTVYKAVHVRINQPVAIKVISRKLAGDADSIARFSREARNAARVQHPNVCRVQDFGETSAGLVYLVMEYIEGESLATLIRREGRLQLARAAHILAQSCLGVAAAHELGIVHRDIKPDNIMLTRGRDGLETVKLVDFGIAKAVTESGQSVTATGLMIGTPEYMSPEQAAGEMLDGRSDTYSLALVFFRMLTGTLPFKADTPMAALSARLITEPLRLSSVDPQGLVPAGLQAVFDRALARNPRDRYASALSFAHDVQQIIAINGTPLSKATTSPVIHGQAREPTTGPVRALPSDLTVASAATPGTPRDVAPHPKGAAAPRDSQLLPPHSRHWARQSCAAAALAVPPIASATMIAALKHLMLPPC